MRWKGSVMSEKTVIVGDLNETNMISTIVSFADDGSGYSMPEVIKVTPGFKKGIEYVLPTFVRQVRNAIRRGRHQNIVGIALASAGEVDPKTGKVLSANSSMPGWAGINLKEEFEREFDLPVSVISEIHASVLGEDRWGESRDKNDSLVVNVATDIVGAYLKGGLIQLGLDQVDHLGKTEVDGVRLETVATVPAIIDHYGDIGGDRVFGHDKRRPRGYAMTPAEMCKRSTQGGEELAIEALRWGGLPLGQAIATLDLGVDEVVITGADVVEFGPVWADAVREGLGGSIKVSVASHRDHATLVGTAENLLRPAFA